MTKERELLRRVLEEWDEDEDGSLTRALVADIRTFLAAEPEAEPACWVVESVNGWNTRSDEPPDSVKATCNCYPLYFHPPRPEPAIKLMTDQEILKGIDADICPYETVLAFVSGARFAERHHGIGGEA
jgi:hypothetical protein